MFRELCSDIPAAEIFFLLVCHLIYREPERGEFQVCNLFIDLLGDIINPAFHLLAVLCNMKRAERLQGETQVHDLDRVTHAFGSREVDQPAFGKDMDCFAFEHERLDTVALDDLVGILVEPFDVDLDIEVAGIGEDGTIFQFLKVPCADDGNVTGCRDEDVTDGLLPRPWT